VPPAEFDALREIALELGFDNVAAGPMVRSSYHADVQAEPAFAHREASCAAP
jgi:lipoyl synthase